MTITMQDCKKAIKKTASISLVSERLEAINKCLEGYGVEAIRGAKCQWHHYYGDICAEYINMGDTYAPTVVFDVRKGRFVATCWGDWVEKNQNKYGII